MHLILFLIVGGIAGVISGKIMSGHGYGIVVDVILGVVVAWWAVGWCQPSLGPKLQG